MKLIVRLAAAVALSAAISPVHAGGYRITNLDPGTYYSEARAINNLGQIVGTTGETQFGDRQGAMWSNGAYSMLAGTRRDTYALDINDHGDVVGYSTETFAGYFRNTDAILWRNGQTIDISYGLGHLSEAHGINNAGVIVGASGNSPNRLRPVMLRDGEAAFLGSGTDYGVAHDVNERNQVVGTGGTNEYARGAMYWDGLKWHVLAATDSSVEALNEDGMLVGRVGNPRMPAGWGPEGEFRFGGDAAQDGEAWDINEAGLAVGWMRSGSRVFAAAWQDGRVLDLTSLIVGDLAGFRTLSFAYGVNDLGQIVGTGITEDGASHAFLLTPVPEPGQWIMLLGGLGVLAWRGRRSAGLLNGRRAGPA